MEASAAALPSSGESRRSSGSFLATVSPTRCRISMTRPASGEFTRLVRSSSYTTRPLSGSPVGRSCKATASICRFASRGESVGYLSTPASPVCASASDGSARAHATCINVRQSLFIGFIALLIRYRGLITGKDMPHCRGICAIRARCSDIGLRHIQFRIGLADLAAILIADLQRDAHIEGHVILRKTVAGWLVVVYRTQRDIAFTQ